VKLLVVGEAGTSATGGVEVGAGAGAGAEAEAEVGTVVDSRGSHDAGAGGTPSATETWALPRWPISLIKASIVFINFVSVSTADG
jgi:hypothetical protein